MRLLAIETSCDETAASVLRDGRVESNVIASQEEHIRYGGVVPELASRAHITKIVPVTRLALAKANTNLQEIEAVAVTYGPGLIGSLLVGLTFAKGIALSRRLPFYGINHLEGHLFSCHIEHPKIEMPFLSLIVSGGHTILSRVNAPGAYEILGQTIDDAAGEAFDKVAKVLGLPYPGGPAVEILAKEGDPGYIKFPVANLKQSALDFSFSGLKTAVLYHYQSLTDRERNRHRADIAAAFQQAVIHALQRNVEKALEQYPVRHFAISGGVAQNKTLAAALREAVESRNCAFFAPSPQYCTDNAAMIGLAAYLRANHNHPASPLSLPAVPNLPLVAKTGQTAQCK